MSQANQVTVRTSSKVLDKDTYQLVTTVSVGNDMKPTYQTFLVDRFAMMQMKHLQGSSAQRLAQLVELEQARVVEHVNEVIQRLKGSRENA